MSTKLTKAQFEAVMAKLKKDGKLTASGILAEAKNKTSALHSFFEWDDTKAASKFRLWQARVMIKRANVSIPEVGKKIVHIPVLTTKGKGKGEGVYKEAIVVVASISDYELAMTEAVRKLASAQNAVMILREIAASESPDKAAILGIAIQGLQTASEAMKHLH